MTTDMEWILGLAATVIIALVGAIYLAGQSRDDKQDARMTASETTVESHVEGLARLEERVDTLEKEVNTLRARWHEIMGDVSKGLADWYQLILKLVSGKK